MNSNTRWGLGLLLAFPVFAQNGLGTREVAARADSSLAVVLAGKSGNQAAVAGAAVAIRQNGVLLTAYHLLRDARAVQVRLNNGDIFDRVQLLGVDARRDVAAIRIAATLSVLPVGHPGELAAGDPVTLVALGVPPQLTSAEGSLSGYSMADEVPGAGQGYRVIRFTVTGLPLIFNGGVLLDGRARVLGLASSISLAVPLESVVGLADSTVAKTFATGAALRPPAAVGGEAIAPSPAAPKREANSAQGSKRKEDRATLLRNLKSVYVAAAGSTTLGADEMKQALRSNPSVSYLGIEVVDQEDQADAILALNHGRAGDYPFELRSPDGMVLVRGSGVGFSTAAGARDVAKYLLQLIRPFRPASGQRGK